MTGARSPAPRPATPDGDRFAPAAAVADAVVYEGYVLYPYRGSSGKNRCRWQFGVLAPPDQVEVDPSERATSRTECIVAAGATPVVHARVRLLHVQRRSLRAVDPAGRWSPVDALDVGDAVITGWDEAVEAVIDLPPVAVGPEGVAAAKAPIVLPARIETEQVTGPKGLVGQIVRTRAPAEGRAQVETRWIDTERRLLQVAVTVTNTTSWSDVDAHRDDMALHALVAVHVMLAVDDGAFVSSLEPPPEAAEAVRACRNEGCFPVLIGADGDTDLVLSSPIILYDHPAVAPESPGDLYDATENDELLSLRVLALTAEEKAEARALDPRAAAIIDRCDTMAPETWADLHGTLREFAEDRIATGPFVAPAGTDGPTGRAGPIDHASGADASNAPGVAGPPAEGDGAAPGDPRVDAAAPGSDAVVVGGVTVAAGSRVVLRPSHRADAHDLFLRGRRATVAGVHRDVNGIDQLVAVTVDDDPATEMLLVHGRHLYFHPDEIEPILADGDAAP